MLEVVESLAGWRERTDELRATGGTVGLTMTMGALHAGHVSLFERSVRDGHVALATIFVNPLQFNEASDLAAYPHDLAADLTLAESAGVHLVLAPPLAEVWPAWPAPTPTSVRVAGLSEVLEGEDRPGHFDGVASVVTKLLVSTGACDAYFGEKDFQQLCVVRQLVADLALAARVIGCPIVREPDGLALSSRNARLTEAGRASARCLSRALREGVSAIESAKGIAATIEVMRRVVVDEPGVALAYAAAVEPATLEAPAQLVAGTELRLLVAAVVDGVRLLDNVRAVVPGPS